MNQHQRKFKIFTSMALMMTLTMGGILGVFGIQKISAQTETAAQNTTEMSAAESGLMKGLGLIGAGMAFGLATLGAGVGVGNASSAAIGALSEKPSMFGISLVFVALCEGLVIFGFVIATMIMGRI
ncbi:MAG: ATP synthase subunit C [Spirochaetia bacterium]